MKKTAQLFCKSNFLSGFANLKSSAAKTKAELTFSIQEYYHIEATGLERLDQLLSDYRVIADSIESILSAKLYDDKEN